jgi:hypothetical protein
MSNMESFYDPQEACQKAVLTVRSTSSTSLTARRVARKLEFTSLIPPHKRNVQTISSLMRSRPRSNKRVDEPASGSGNGSAPERTAADDAAGQTCLNGCDQICKVAMLIALYDDFGIVER